VKVTALKRNPRRRKQHKKNDSSDSDTPAATAMAMQKKSGAKQTKSD
jgi:hypothetical protein